MDNGTLNEYMWIIVVLIVGSVLLTFTSPFGKFLFSEITSPIIEAMTN